MIIECVFDNSLSLTLQNDTSLLNKYRAALGQGSLGEGVGCLPNEVIVYNNREINGREFDFCILMKNVGLIIVEVKGWIADSIFDVAGVDEIIIQGYSKPEKSPKKQARAYRFGLLNMINERFNVSPLIFDMVCYPFISKNEYYEKRLDIASEESLTIFKEDIEDAGKLGEKLHVEVVEIEDKMDATNRLLTQKFDEFSELLKKSNTEALVEVMKKVTEEFQKQMNALINKLIQENFDQLNKSVERLNQWQQENKEMIARLTAQYKEMATDFEGTSTTLTRVKDDTETLVSSGGKLHQIIDALNKVIVEDEKFIKISSDLQSTATLTKTNFEQFDASTKALNDWVKKQRNFVDAVSLLIQKLDELNRIRNYGEEFWKETRTEMNKTVSTMTKGSETLKSELAGIDRQFYQRLNVTLANLDACIQAMVKNNEKQ